MRMAAIVAGVLVIAAMCLGAVTSEVDVEQSTANGYQRIVWEMAADGDGVDAVRTTQGVYGIVYKVLYIPDSDAQIQGGETFTVSIKPVGYYDETWWEGAATTVNVTATTDGIAVAPMWPTTTVTVAGDIEIGVGSAETSAGAGASGRIIVVVSPCLAGT